MELRYVSKIAAISCARLADLILMLVGDIESSEIAATEA